jgi:type IV secretory pathway VirJ component
MQRVLLAFVVLLALGSCGSGDLAELRLNIPPYGIVHVIRHKGVHPNTVVMFSGPQGWTKELTARAWGVSWPDRLVIGIETPAYLKAIAPATRDGKSCFDYTAGLPQLLRSVSAVTQDTVDPAPFLIGADTGGTVALISAAQSQPKSVEGVVAENFCPRQVSTIPPCSGPGGVQEQPAADGKGLALAAPKALQTPFVAIADAAQCPATNVDDFVEAMPDGRTVDPVPDRAIDLLISVAMQTGAHLEVRPAVSDADMADLPLFEVPSTPGHDPRLAIIMTGDGGWADIDKALGDYLAQHGVGVVGFSTLKYFWKTQTPEQTAADLERVIRHYTKAWNRKNVVLIGYSFGAGVLPFVIPRLPDDVQKSIRLVALVAPPEHADFEISVGGWIGEDDDGDSPEAAPAISALPQRVLCIRSSDEEDDNGCPAQNTHQVTVQVFKGGHHFDGAYAPIAQQILSNSAAVPAAPVKN